VGPKLEATDAALEPPTLTVSARSGSIITARRAPLHQTQRRLGGGSNQLRTSRANERGVGRRTRRSEEAEVPNLLQSVRRGATRPRAARRHSTRRICRSPPFFLATRRLTDTRGLPPTDRYRAAPARPSVYLTILLRSAAATVAAAGRNGGRWGGGRRSGAVGSGT
jgi:hypothetical protein